MGAVGKYGTWVDKNNRVTSFAKPLLMDWARKGLTDKNIAQKIGISQNTLYAWMRKSEDFRTTIKMNQEWADAVVESSLFKTAVDGDVTACIFWLVNRQPNRWKRNPETSNNNADKNNINDIVEALRETNV